MLRWAALSTAALMVAVIAGCGTDPTTHEASDKINVVAAFYPLEFLAERIGGDRVTVTNLVARGAEPHDVELRPSQVAQVANADLVLYLHGFQPAVDEAVAQHAGDRALDLSSVGDGKDPHIWLDPVRFGAAAEQVAARLAAVDPGHAKG